MARLYHRDATSCSFAGKTYEKGKDGAFEVPEVAVAALLDHGFVTDPKFLVSKPDAQLVIAAGEAEKVASHAKAELAKVSEERDALAKRAEALEKRVQELEAAAK